MSIQEQIFGLEVSIYNTLSMEIIEGKSNLSCIELGHRVRETLFSA